MMKSKRCEHYLVVSEHSDQLVVITDDPEYSKINIFTPEWGNYIVIDKSIALALISTLSRALDFKCNLEKF